MLSLAIMALFAAQATSADEPPVTPQVVVTGPARSPDQRRICRVLEQTSSRIGGARICKTQAEWEQERHVRQVDAADTLSNLHDRLDQEAPRRPGPSGAPR